MRKLALLSLLLASTALAQTRQPATITTQPNLSPEPVDILDSGGGWARLGWLDKIAHVFWPQTYEYNPRSAGVKCDNSTDDAAALNAFFASIPAKGVVSFPPGVICRFGSQLALPPADGVTINGNWASLEYVGADTTINAIVWGSHAGPQGCTRYSEVIRNLNVHSATVMTAGDGLQLNNICLLFLDGVVVGSKGTNLIHDDANWFNALHINGGGSLRTSYLRFRGSNDGEIINGGPTTQYTDAFHSGLIVADASGQHDIHIAGWCGGCAWDDTDALGASASNILVDQSQTPGHQNGQIRFGPNFASDGGGATLGLDIQDTGMSAGFPAFMVATASWTTASTTIATGSACPPTTSNTTLMDMSLTPPQIIGSPSACAGGVLTLGAAAKAASLGSTDNLTVITSPGPGLTGSELFCEGCWLSTVNTCVRIGSNVNYMIHLMSPRIRNCPVAGIDNYSPYSITLINGGVIGNNGVGVRNNVPGGHIEFQGRPSMQRNIVADEQGLAPTILSGFGGATSVIGDDADFYIAWGAGGGTTGQIAYQYQHTRSVSGGSVMSVTTPPTFGSFTPGTSSTTGIGITVSGAPASGNSLFVNLIGPGF
jgi:hypothetical protein